MMQYESVIGAGYQQPRLRSEGLYFCNDTLLCRIGLYSGHAPANQVAPLTDPFCNSLYLLL